MGIELLGRAGEKALESSSLWAGRDHRGRPAGGKDSLLLTPCEPALGASCLGKTQFHTVLAKHLFRLFLMNSVELVVSNIC